MIGHSTNPSYCHQAYLSIGLVPSYQPGLGNTVGDEGGDETVQVGEGYFPAVRGERTDVEVEKEGYVDMGKGDGDDEEI